MRRVSWLTALCVFPLLVHATSKKHNFNHTYKMRSAGNQPYLEITSKQGQQILLSQANPVAGTGPLNLFFKNEHRPMTWKEAHQSCSKFDLFEARWELPTQTDFELLIDLGLVNLMNTPTRNSPTPELDKNYRKSYLTYKNWGPQFAYFWTQEKEDSLPEGLRKAVRYTVAPVIVSHTVQKPLPYFCLTRIAHG